MSKQTTRILSGGLLAAALAAPGWYAGSAVAQTNAGATTKPADKITELFGDQVVARGQGLEIKRSEFDTAFIAVKAAATARGSRIPPEYMSNLERQVLNDLIGMRLLLMKATAEDKAKAEEEFQKSFQKYKADEKITDAEFEERLGPQLIAQGLTREKWQQQRVDQSSIKLVLERELKPSVTDEDVKKYYEEHPSNFEQPEMVRASHILLGTRDQATGTELPEDKKQAKRIQMEEILKRARGGEDFAKLAKEYSEDPGSKDQGGEYTFPRGKMVPAFESAAFSLATNQISDIVTTQFGYHIIKLSEKLPAQKVELAKVADDLKEQLKQRAVQEQLKDYMPKLIQDANVEILDEKLKSKEPAPAPIPLEKTDPKKK
jgi:parvulin-like peptidyl-prolyl isomerase